MAKKTTRQSTKPAVDAHEELRWPFGPRNYLIFAMALVVIVIGYVTLGYGSMTLSPILLVLGYCVLLPIAIVVKGKPEEHRSSADIVGVSSPPS